ncbi:hypothetical protein, partial [Tolypothrix sp. VBCCA 56010]|uniref:hypothetical protein n=1 Tax=Tolypothrix sp. VBCCA 56010 TaxID=3137731 RepID=UPI003D7E9F92
RVWLRRECFPRDNRFHAPCEERSKCLDLSRFYIADNVACEYQVCRGVQSDRTNASVFIKYFVSS